MNKLLNGLKEEFNVGRTTNGAIAYNSTLDSVYDLFATGAAMRHASNLDCIRLFAVAYEENPTLALKCLFYLRDIRGNGQGERRFFRLCIKWLAVNYPDEMEHLIALVSTYGRYDDLFELLDTPCEAAMMGYIKYVIDKNEDHLVYKWMPSINASSHISRVRGGKFAHEFGMTERQYRKMLSEGRKVCNLVETLMSQNEWNQIQFDRLPSRAGLLYSKAFARREETKARYAEFMSNRNTKVNAKSLYPYDVVRKAREIGWRTQGTERLAINKYWDNLNDYFNGASLNALCVCDTSRSMTWNTANNIIPIDVAISLSLYTAERAKGPFHNHFISFSRRPTLIETTGMDFCDKVFNIYRRNLCENTNIEATFDLILNTALQHGLAQSDLPATLIIITDMMFDDASYSNRNLSLMENIETKWNGYGYKMPSLIFWNVNAANKDGKFPMKNKEGITFVSGASPSIFIQIMTGRTGIQLMLDALNSERYEKIYSIN